MYLNDRFVYNPNIEYFFLSVRYVGRCPAWIRRPFLTKTEVDNFIQYEYGKNPRDFKDLSIYPESVLRNLIHVKDENGELVEIDIRTWLFDDRYSSRTNYYQKILQGKLGIGYKAGFNEWVEKTGFKESEFTE